MPEQILLTESATLLEGSARGSGRRLMQLISPGWGSSGFYSTEVLEQAATDGVIPASTHMYADHPTETEAIERPGRSIRDLVSVTTEPARVATEADVAEGADPGALVAEIRVVSAYRDLIDEIGDSIGVSILGDATDITIGEAEGRTGRIIEGLAHVASVDWVTRAGRGGRVLSLLESARVNQRATGRGIAEATVNDTREALQTALRELYGRETVRVNGVVQTAATYVWVRDFDDTTVWFEIDGPGSDTGLYAQTYADSDGAVSLTGDRTEVRVVTTYVPVRPGGTTTTESQEDNMPRTLEESERLLTEATGRVTTLESERDTAVAERDQLRIDNARLTARESAISHARSRVTEANAQLPAATVDRIVTAATATIPLTEAGALDTTALDTAVDAARTSEETYLAGLAEAAGVGSITGFGGTPTTPTAVTESDIDAAVGGAFGRKVKEA